MDIRKSKIALVFLAMLTITSASSYDAMSSWELNRTLGGQDIVAERGYLEPIISARCIDTAPVNYIYYETPADLGEGAENFFHDTRHNLSEKCGESSCDFMKPHIDMRYVNNVHRFQHGGEYDFPNAGRFTGLDTNYGDRNVGVGTRLARYYAGGGIAQAKCVDGYMAFGTMLNLYDVPEQDIPHGGLHTAFSYSFYKPSSAIEDGGASTAPSPWVDGGGNLMLQGQFERPWYKPYTSDHQPHGAQLSIALYLYNRNDLTILTDYVIKAYTGDAEPDTYEVPLRIDPATGAIHAGTVFGDDTVWVTKSPYSNYTQTARQYLVQDDGEWEDFYRVNITYENMLSFIDAAGLDAVPEDFFVGHVLVLVELSERGKASFAGSFRAFEAYITDEAW